MSGQQFDIPFSDFTYELNGTPPTLNVGGITVFSASNFGLFTICLNVACGTASPIVNPANGIYTEGSQIYTGTESAPTIVPGVYPESASNAPMEFFVNKTEYDQTTGSVTIAKVTSTPPVPEPSTLLTLVAAIGLIAWRRPRATSQN